MNYSSIRAIYIVILFLTFFFIGFFVAGAQTTNDVQEGQLHVTSMSQFDIYPYYNNIPGVCILGGVSSPENTSMRLRYTTVFNTGQGFTFSNQTVEVNPPSQNFQAIVGLNMLPETEYAFQWLEQDINGDYYDITPDDLGDNIKQMCTPTTTGELSDNCGLGSFVVTDCSPAGVNQAMQNAGEESGVVIDSISTEETSFSFMLDTTNNSVSAGDSVAVVYSTNQQAVASANFQGLENTSVVVNASQQTPVSIAGLSASTAYYVTVIDQNQTILLDTSSNQPYQVITTSAPQQDQDDNGGSDNQAPATISVNIGDVGSNPQLAGEEIDQGLVQCGFGEFYDCDFNQLLATIDRVLKFLLYIIALPIAALLFAVAGIRLIIAKAQAKKSAMESAKKMLGKVVLGLVFALAAWVIVKFVLVILGYNDPLVSQILDISLD